VARPSSNLLREVTLVDRDGGCSQVRMDEEGLDPGVAPVVWFVAVYYDSDYRGRKPPLDLKPCSKFVEVGGAVLAFTVSMS
jgi:hypothetical protein